jgi:uncharacterized protein (TIGR03435 family)
MKQLRLALGAALLVAAPAFAQSPAPSPRFDITSVQVSTRPNGGMRGGILRGTRYELRNATMLDLIRTAYNVQPGRVTGGPSWLEWNRYDVAALAPAGTPPPVLRQMLQALLAERFKLAVHEDQAAVPGFALTVGGTHKLRPASGPGTCQGQGAPNANGIPVQTVTCKGQTMATLAEQLPRSAGAYFPPGTQVVDETGLTGFWDFEMQWMPRQVLAQAGGDAITIQAALERLGLKLEPRELKLPAIVVNSVNAEFTPNPPNLAARMPAPPPPEFEVAEVKPSPPEAQGPRARILPTGQVVATGVPLNMMMALAWSLPASGFIAGPKWIESSRFELIARAFADQGANPEVDEDILRRMLQSLIVERFQMKYHMEDRPMPAYTLTADGPKMTRADPSKRTRCTEGPIANLDRARAALARQITCTNVTMAQFGRLIPEFAGGYTTVPVLDRTGLEGGWDFTLSFSPVGQVKGPRPEAGSAPTGAAADPTGAVSLSEAISRQLGLKLEEQKRPLPVMVIDSISDKPTGN